MTLVDDIKGDAAGDKQFIVVHSRGGAYFYIVIDNAAEGENRVHFLNQVDEADLLSIIDEDLQSIQKTLEPVVEPAPPTTEPEQPKENNSLYGLILFLLVARAGRRRCHLLSQSDKAETERQGRYRSGRVRP